MAFDARYIDLSIVRTLMALTGAALAGLAFADQSAATKVVQQQPNKTVVQQGGTQKVLVKPRGVLQVDCPASINVQVDDSITGADWPTRPAKATFVRAQFGYVNRETPGWAICVYKAWGGEFKIKRQLDYPYDKCTTFAVQGGSGGLRCE